MRGKIGPSGINDEAPKGRGKGGPVLLFEAENRPTGRGIHHILIYFPPSHLLVSNIGKKKLDLLTHKNQNFLFQNIHIIRPSHPHIGTARNLHRFSQHFQIFNSQIFSSSRLLSHTILSFLRFQTSSAFKLFFFFPQTLDTNKKESQGVVSLVRH